MCIARAWGGQAFCLALALSACGRLGFEPLSPTHGKLDAGYDVPAPLAEVADAPPGLQGGDLAVREVGGPGGKNGSSVDAPFENDGGADANEVCTSSLFWRTHFDEDPTTLDLNGDGTPDWVRRGSSAFPANSIIDGVWHAAPGLPLDTSPYDSFASRTLVDVTLQSLSVPQALGAVFWINVNGVPGQMFSALYVSLELTPAGTQRLRLFGKLGSEAVLLKQVNDLPSGFVRVRLDIDAPDRTVALEVQGRDEGAYAFPQTGPPKDPFATLIAWAGSGDVRFGSAEVIGCTP